LDKLYGDPIRKKFPYVKLQIIVKAKGTTAEELVSSNTPIDLIFGSIGAFHANIFAYNLQKDMSDLIKSHNYDLTKLEPALLEMQHKLAPDGKSLYGLPVYVGISGLYYNKDIFDKFGVAYPKDNMTWDQMYELAGKLNRTDGGTRYFGYTGSPGIQLSTNQLSLDPIDPKTLKSNYNTDPWKKFLETVVAGYKSSGLTKAQLKDAEQRALFEKDMVVGMWTNYSGGTPPETMNWDVATVPTFKEAPGIGPGPYPSYWYVPSTTKHRDAAFDIIAYLTSEEFQVPFNRQGYATAFKDSAIKKQFGQDLPKFKGKHVEAMFPQKPASPIAYTQYHNFAQTAWNDAFIDVASGAKDINTALREAAESVDKSIEGQKGAK
jgi:multiple sugar transport system substrate-binding protein